MLLNNQLTVAENLYYKGRFFQREILKKNVVYFARRDLIVLYILFLRANFTSNTRWESQTFHHDENLSGLFRRVFKVILIRVNYISRLFKQNYTRYVKLYITLRYTTFCSNMTSHKKGRCHWKCGNALKFSKGDIAGVSQLKISL